MAVDSQTLLAASNCYMCNTPGEWQLMKLSLLRQIALSMNSMADVTPQGLINQANCYNCFGNPGMWQLMELALLAQIAQNGGSGGSLTCGNYGGGQPSFTPASGCGLALDTSNGRPWWYYNGAWH